MPWIQDYNIAVKVDELNESIQSLERDVAYALSDKVSFTEFEHFRKVLRDEFSNGSLFDLTMKTSNETGESLNDMVKRLDSHTSNMQKQMDEVLGKEGFETVQNWIRALTHWSDNLESDLKSLDEKCDSFVKLIRE